MRDGDLFTPRPRLTGQNLPVRAVEAVGRGTTSLAEVQRRPTERFAVDLDAVAALMPCREAEPIRLETRG